MKNKVVLVGAGMVGAAYAYSAINQGLVNELAIVDVNEKAAKGQALDLVDSICFLPRQPKIYAGQYSDCKDADIVVITAGVAQKPGQPRTELVGTNAKIMTSIVEQVMASGFDGIIVVASNPVDIMTLVAQKVSKLPTNRVFGSGTTLDSARLRKNLSKYLGYNPTNIHANILGEHGDSSLAAWSTATVGQKPILEIVAESNGKLTEEGLNKCFVDARDAAYEIIENKGATYFGIGIALARITKAIFANDEALLTCGVYLDGKYGIDGIYLPVPAVIGSEGVKEIQDLKISDDELTKLQASANALKDVMKGAGLDY